MEDAIRDVFPYGPAEIIIMYTAAARRKEIHEELMTKIQNGERLIRHRTWAVGGVFVKNGDLAYHIARDMFNRRNRWWRDGLCTNGHICLAQHENSRELIRSNFLIPPPFSRGRDITCARSPKSVRLTRQIIIDYLTCNGFQKIKSKSKSELIKLVQTF